MLSLTLKLTWKQFFCYNRVLLTTKEKEINYANYAKYAKSIRGIF